MRLEVVSPAFLASGPALLIVERWTNDTRTTIENNQLTVAHVTDKTEEERLDPFNLNLLDQCGSHRNWIA